MIESAWLTDGKYVFGYVQPGDQIIKGVLQWSTPTTASYVLEVVKLAVFLIDRHMSANISDAY